MTISLRRMQSSDISLVENFSVQDDQAAFVEPLRETLKRTGSRINFIIDDSGFAVGFFQIDHSSSTQCIANYLELHEVSIDRLQQGKGYGRAFVLALPKFLHSEFPDWEGVCLTVNCKNKGAKRLYELGGFTDTNELKLEGRSGPQHVMQLTLCET